MKELFTFESFKMLVEKTADKSVVSEAFVQVQMSLEQAFIPRLRATVRVNALDNALRKALVQYFLRLPTCTSPTTKFVYLTRRMPRAAKVRVLIESKNTENTWNTVGVSENVIEASWEALVHSFRYALLQEKLSRTSRDVVHTTAFHGLSNH